MTCRHQRFHPALLSLTTLRCKRVRFKSGPKHQGEGKRFFGLQTPDGTALQHDDPQQVAVGGALLVEEQVRLQNKPSSLEGGGSHFLSGRKACHDSCDFISVHVCKIHLYVWSFVRPFCRGSLPYQLEKCMTSNGSESSRGLSSQLLKMRN